MRKASWAPQHVVRVFVKHEPQSTLAPKCRRGNKIAAADARFSSTSPFSWLPDDQAALRLNGSHLGANDHHAGMDRRTEIPDEPPDKSIELVHVNCHTLTPSASAIEDGRLPVVVLRVDSNGPVWVANDSGCPVIP
jgi:hypothetical protein